MRWLRSSLNQSPYWQSRSPRERRLITALCGAIFVFLFWLLAYRPAAQLVNRYEAQLPISRQALAQLRADAARVPALQREAQGLARIPIATLVESRRLVQAAESLGAPKGGIELSYAERRVRVSLNAMPLALLIDWLAAVGREHALVVESADFTRDAAGRATGTLTLSRLD